MSWMQFALAAVIAIGVAGGTRAQTEIEDGRVLLIAADPVDLLGGAPNTVSIDEIIYLNQSQSIIISDAAGGVHEITGPFEGTLAGSVVLPRATPAGWQFWQTVRAFLQRGEADADRLGATRASFGDEGDWVLPIEQLAYFERFCLPETADLVLSRRVRGFDQGESIELRPVDGEYPVIEARFPRRASAVQLAADTSLSGTYEVLRGEIPLGVVNFYPLGSTSADSVAVQLMQSQCEGQLDRLLGRLTAGAF